jgi:hypothetical protein
VDKITIEWASDAKTVILCIYHQDGWTWEDIFVVLDKQRAMIESSPAPVVDVIVDATNSTWLPRGGSLLGGVRKLTSSQHPRQGHTIIVGARGMVAAIVDVLLKIIGSKRVEFHLTKTRDQADKVVAELQASRQQQKAS